MRFAVRQVSWFVKNGVMIMIDDKPTQMSEEDLLRFLQSMPASSIDRIEIINNPSSRYDAAGTSGIINIKLKKDKNLGFNGTASLTMAYGFTPKYNANINTNYRTKKYNVFANVTPGRWQNKNVQLLDRDFYQNAKKTTFNQNFTENYGDKDAQAKVGVDFFLNDKTTLGLMTTAYGGKTDNIMDNTINIVGYNPDIYDKITATGNGIDNSSRMAYNVNFKRVLDTLGRELTLDADFSTFGKDATNLVDNRYTVGTEKAVAKLPFMIRSNSNTDLKVFAVKADYVRPLKDKSTLEMGWKSSLVSIGNGINFETSSDNFNWQPSKSRNNDFEYKENINALYLNYTKPFSEKWNLQTGLRVENTNNEGHSITLDSTVVGRYTNLFPSANLTYTANAKNMFNFAYSLRIDRPSYQDLNPFVFYIDEFTFGKGNPFLKPQYTNSFTLTHTYMEMFTTTVFYSHTKDNITQVLGQEPNSKNAYQTNVNLADFNNFSFTLGSPIPIQKWWNGYASLTGFYNSYKAEYQGNKIDNNQWSYNFYVENNITLPKKWTVQASCWYNSSLVYGVFKLKPQYSVDLGCSKKLNDRAKLKFAITDIFQTNRNKINVDDNGLTLRMRGINESRRASLTFSYNFGNMNVKAARKRSTATEDEMNRVKKK
jgi:hypothetical protein